MASTVLAATGHVLLARRPIATVGRGNATVCIHTHGLYGSLGSSRQPVSHGYWRLKGGGW